MTRRKDQPNRLLGVIACLVESPTPLDMLVIYWILILASSETLEPANRIVTFITTDCMSLSTEDRIAGFTAAAGRAENFLSKA